MTTFDNLEEGMSAIRHSDWPFIINLSNSIIGIAVLALPFCFKECGLILGLFLLLGSAWITDITCHMLMRAASITKKRSYEYLALHVFGIAGKFTIEFSIIGLLIGTCIAFYIIIGDIGPVIVSNLTGLENTNSLRTLFMVTVTLFGILPLGMMQNLDSLSRFSAVSLSFYSCFALHVAVSAFTNLFSGVWINKVVYWNPDGLFKCLPIFALSYSCQTQLFIINEAMPESTLKRMDVVTRKAVLIVSCLYVVVGLFGYIAFFDDEISGDVLMNFKPTFLSELMKLGFVLSTVISFPLVIFPCRASIYTLFFAKPQPTNKLFDSSIVIPSDYFKAITVAIVFLTLCIGIAVPNVEFMLAITGATMGSLICYIFPALMAITIASYGHGKQKLVSQFVLFVGIAVLLASTYTTLSTQERLAAQESVVKVAGPIEHADYPGVRDINDEALNIGHGPPDLHERIAVITESTPTPATVKLSTIRQLPSSDKKPGVAENTSNFVRDPLPNNDQVKLPVQRRLIKQATAINKTQASLPVSSNNSIAVPIQSAKNKVEKPDSNDPILPSGGEGDLAKNLLEELRKQNEEQKRLLKEQREIVDELKLHQMEIHRIDDKHWHQEASINFSAPKVPAH